MGDIMILIVTLITIIVLGVRNRRIDRKLKTRIKEIVKDVNETYKSLFTETSHVKRMMQLGLISIAGLSSLINIYTSVMVYVDIELYSDKLEWILKIAIIFVSFILVQYMIGYILYISLKIQSFIHNVEHKNLKIDFILSYFMISTYLTVLLIFPDEFIDNIWIGIVGMVICYYLNIKILITVIANPSNVKSIKEEDNGFSRLIAASILILLMIILNLYLIVCLVNGLEPNAFFNAKGNFDLFYYTIITFTTIGYGDILPNTVLAKVTSIVISITSVVCLSIFISSILSHKDELSNK